MAGFSSGPKSQADERLQTITSGSLKWTDISDSTASETGRLGRDYGFHSLDLQDCLTGKVTKVEDHGDHMFILLHFPEKDSRGLIISNRVAMFLGEDYLVTLHPGNLMSILQLFESCRDDDPNRSSLMKSSAFLAYRIIDALMDGVLSVLDEVQGELDEIEAVVFDEKKTQAGPINHARRKIAALGRIHLPLRLFLPELSKAQKFSKDDLSIYFSDLNHKVGMSSRNVDEMKELVEIYKDTDFVISSNRTNNILAILTIIFTLTIPATVISSIYGMNVPLPGGWDFGVSGPLNFFGPYSSLLVIFIVMLIPAAIMVWYFKRVGWF